MKRNAFVILMMVMLLMVSLNIMVFAAEPEFKLRFATVGVPNDAHTKALYVFEEEIEKLSEGRIEVSIHHSGQLFTQEAGHAALRRGTLAMDYLSPSWLTEYIPAMSMFSAGYLFKDYEHMTKVMNGPIGQKLYEEVAETIGARPLGAFYLGTRQLNLRDIGRKVMTPDDLKGVKLRMPNAPAWLFLGRALGANPTPVSFTELYMALKTGTVDGQDNPLPTDRNAKFYEVTDQIILTDHLVDMVLPCINEELWQKMDDELHEYMYQAIEKARQACDKLNLEQEAELVAFFREQGLDVYVPDKEAFMTRVQNAYLEDKEMSKTWDMKLFEEIQSMVE